MIFRCLIDGRRGERWRPAVLEVDENFSHPSALETSELPAVLTAAAIELLRLIPTGLEGAMIATFTTFFPRSRVSIPLKTHRRRLACEAGSSRLRRSRHWTLLPVIVLLLAARPAVVSADSITLDQDLRRAAVFGRDQRAADVLTVTESFSGVSGTAKLISSISDLHHLTGTGVAALESVGTANFFAAASSAFVVGFTIDAPHNYSFRGSWNGSGDKMGTARLTLVEPGALVGDRFFNHLVNGPGVFESSRRLPSGTYSFEVTTNVVGSSFSPAMRLGTSFDFAFDLQAAPTPEPASIFLLGSGLVVVAGRIRRRSRTNWP